MKNIRRIFSFIFIISLLFLSLPFAPAKAALTDWHRGASIQPFSTTDIGSTEAKRAMDSLKSTGANYVTLIIPYYQNNRQSTEMYPSWNTPTDAALIIAIDYAHSIGLKVMLKPHLETDYIEWRGNIDPAPADRPAWFESYGKMLEHYGRIAQAHNVEDYCIGTEILRMANPQYHSDNTTQWKKLIERVRAVYSGKVTYSANWYGELEYDQFWGDLDYIGVSAYYDLYHASNNSVAELEKSWDGWRSGVLEPMQKKYNKDIVFTELGYRSINGAYRDPWDWSRDAGYNETDQANSYEALFHYWDKYPWMKGVSLWRWAIYPPPANSGDKDYMPQNKLAQSVMTKYWGGLGSTPSNPLPPTATTTPPTSTTTNPTPTQPPADPTPVQGTSWSASASVIPNPPSSGSNVSITTVVKNQSSLSVPGTIVDFEIYNSSGQQVYQKYFENQNFAANQQKSYNVNWTAGSNGNYTFKVGVFNSNWTHNYYWGDAVVPIGVGGSATPPPTNNPPPPTSTTTTPSTPPPTNTETSLEIWWPGNGATVSGLQPFKAMLTNRDIANYKMFWQVDGDRLNEMANSTQDYPHKESLVDLTGWNWKGTGPYNINFVAQDFNGTTIKQKSVNINIVQ
jgi:hypothetical protein